MKETGPDDHTVVRMLENEPAVGVEIVVNLTKKTAVQGPALKDCVAQMLLIPGIRREKDQFGNGTASRETETLTKAALRELDAPANGERPQVVVVNEAGASVYNGAILSTARV